LRFVLPAQKRKKPQMEPAPYPVQLAVMLGEPTFVAEDYAALRQRHGAYAVMLLRGAEVTACLVATSIVKVGALGMHTKAVPTEAVAPFLTAQEYVLLAPHAEALVCTPPVDAAKALVLADLAASEDNFFATKLQTLAALDAVLGITPERVALVLAEMVRYLTSATEARGRLVERVSPPPTEWDVYAELTLSAGSLQDPMDSLAAAIRSFAAKQCVWPPLPDVDDAEVEALFRIHDMLVEHGLTCEAGRLAGAALSAPAHARWCHRPDIFAKDRSPPLQARWASFGIQMLEHLLSEEVTRRASEPVTLASPYVLTLRELIALGVPHAPESEARAFERLDTYVGGYLRELDLSKTLVTGSAIAAALIATDVEAALAVTTRSYALTRETTAPSRAQLAFVDAKAPDAFERYLASYYPTTRTVPRDRDAYARLVRLLCHHSRWSWHSHAPATLEYETDGAVLTVTARLGASEERAVLDMHIGADVDMAVVVDTNEAFDAVARAHHAVIRARYPEAALAVVPRGDPARYSWSITCAGSHTFRPVELYRASFDHVATHHVGMVSGAYTALFAAEGSEAPQFVVTARLALSMARLATPNYYYFASRKTTPQDVVVKYLRRGFGLSAFPPDLRCAIQKYADRDKVHVGRARTRLWKPALEGRGHFSAFSIATELGWD
jgi:hypothetical protein